MIRVLLVDDQELVRAGFRIILESEPGIAVVGEAADGAAAVQLAASQRPDVICMDVEMPVMDGIAASRTILTQRSAPSGSDEIGSDEMSSPPAILILTTFGHESYLFDALAAGVSGFLLKTSRAEQLIEAVRSLAAGNALLGPDVTRAVIDRVAADRAPALSETSGQPTQNGMQALAAAGLTERECDVLRLLAEGRSNAEIAAALFLGESTIKTHVSNLLQKLGARDRIQAVVWAHTNGAV